MPTVKIRSKGAKVTAKPAKSKATTSTKPGKRDVARADVDKQRKQVASELKKGASIGDIAKALHVTAGRAKYLQMLNEVEAGTVPRISTSGDDAAIAKRIVAAREKQDAHSSWGYISARTGIPEARVKALAESAGHKVKGSHVAKERAAARKPAASKAKASSKGKGSANPSK